jgi:hypothetical protein
LERANLEDATLGDADLRSTNLLNTNLENANLGSANLTWANLWATNLTRANLGGANLRGADLLNTILNSTRFMFTIFANVNFVEVVGLETCEHGGPSYIDYQTLQRSHPLPISFLRGVGLPDRLIEYLPSIFNHTVQYYSCFISYSTKDQDFAERIHADLQNRGVRCWFAPHDMPIGGKILDEIDAAIRLRDKLLLVMSQHSIESDWVEDEVTAAFEEERKRGQIVLFPIRLDDSVLDTNAAWAAKLRARLIGDFRNWKDHSAYMKSLERVIRDLTPHL